VSSHRLTGLHHVQLAMPAGREQDAEDFYAGVLGLERVPKPEALAGRGGAWFRGGGVEVHLGVEEDFRPARKAHPAFLVDGLDALEARLRETGAPVRPDEPFDGRRRFHTDDPFGNRLELLAAEVEM
jgi:catechol 2,3-dioxygenase-like lactoylglutathione lyase family enzyme